MPTATAARRRLAAGRPLVLQGGQSYLDGNYQIPTLDNNPYYADAYNYFGSYAAMDAAATPSTDFGVEIMNLLGVGGDTPEGESAQNQLVYLGDPAPQDQHDPVPDGGSTLALLAPLALALPALRAGERRLALQRCR